MIKEKLKRGSVPYKLYLYFNIFIRYYFFYRNRKTFSQFGEDLFIKKFFEYKKKGKYVDLGAFHPMRLSNTYLLYKNGWSGTNVDLNPIRKHKGWKSAQVDCFASTSDQVRLKYYVAGKEKEEKKLSLG